MLQQQHPPSASGVGSTAEADRAVEAIQFILDFVRRQYRVIGFATAVAIVMGIVYVSTTPPRFTATATMLIDTQNGRLSQQQSVDDFSMAIDSGMVESQVEILKSEKVALAVIKKLDLTADPEFVGPGGGLVGTFFNFVNSLFESNEPTSEYALTRAALGRFRNRLDVRRIGLTYVIAISFESLDPDRAAEISNAVPDAYIDDQLEAKYQTTRRAGVWLQERLSELREQAAVAERAVVEFKNKNNMIDTGGRTINEQQLAELNSELVIAQAHTAEASARVDRVQSVLTSNSLEAVVNATVSDTLNNPVISSLREQYLTLSARYEDWVPRYGANHLAVVNVHNQMIEIQNSIRNELQRIAETYKSDLEIAKQREDTVQNQLNQAVSQSQVTNQAQVVLRQLETNAESYQALYDNFLQRYMESVQQESFPITDARVISAATRPLSKSHPNNPLVLTLATVVGLAFGMTAGAWREFADRVFRTRNQIESLLQTDCIALVPAVESTQRGSVSDTGREIEVAKEFRSPETEQRTITIEPGLFSMIVDSPFSAFAESIRSIKVAVDSSQITADLSLASTRRQASGARKPKQGVGCKIIGFTSSVPNEGKSSVVVSVARLAAHVGARTLLVDCDLKNPSLSRSLAPIAPGGLLEVLREELTLEKVIWSDPVTNMKFLPAVMKSRLANSSEILASLKTRAFFDSLRDSYEYIFMDLAPLMPIVDVRAATRLVDSYVYIVEWGRTRVDFVEQALGTARGVYEHLIGVVLNKVNLKSLGRYDGRDSYYHHGHYHRYGYTE
jgi:succinoglycan biosynthesis transport protein ExoP